MTHDDSLEPPVMFTEALVVDAFERCGFGTVTVVAPISRLGDGTAIEVQLPPMTPLSRFRSRAQLLYDYLGVRSCDVYVETAMSRECPRQLSLWVHDGDTAMQEWVRVKDAK